MWIAGVGATLVLAVAALMAYVVVTLPPDDQYYVEQPSVNEAIAEPCRQMQIAGEAIPLNSTTAETMTAMLTFAEVARAIPKAIDTVDEADKYAIKWRDGWIGFIEATEAYANAGGKSPWVSQRDDKGARIIENLQFATEVECYVPTAIEILEYPETTSQDY